MRRQRQGLASWLCCLQISTGKKYLLFSVLKAKPSTNKATQEQNWKNDKDLVLICGAVLSSLSDGSRCRIYGNRSTWWAESIMLDFLVFTLGLTRTRRSAPRRYVSPLYPEVAARLH